jgi:hypothetical protein
MPIMIQAERKKDIQKIILRTAIRPDEPLGTSSGFKRKIVNFSLRFLPALKSTRKEKRSIRNGSRESIKIMLYLYYFFYMMSTHSIVFAFNLLPFQSMYIAG